MKLVVQIPCLNEEESLPETIPQGSYQGNSREKPVDVHQGCCHESFERNEFHDVEDVGKSQQRVGHIPEVPNGVDDEQRVKQLAKGAEIQISMRVRKPLGFANQASGKRQE